MPCRKTESPQSAVCSATISSDPGISGARGTKAPCFLASFSIAVSINDVFNNVLRLQCCPLVHRICFARCVRSPPQVCAGHKAWKSLSIAKARRASGCRLHAGGLEGFAEVASNSKLHRRRSISQLSVRFLMFFDLANFARVAAFSCVFMRLRRFGKHLTQDPPDEDGVPLTPCPTCNMSSSHLGSLPYSLSDLSDLKPERRCGHKVTKSHKESHRTDSNHSTDMLN